MFDALKELARSLDIPPAMASVIIISLILLGFFASLAYKENLFGLRNKIRKFFKAEPDDTFKDTTTEYLPEKKAPDSDPPPNTVEVIFKSTSPVDFKNERLPDTLKLQRAVHDIIKSENNYIVPFHYDAQIAFLREKIKRLYEQYEHRIAIEGEEADPIEFSMLRGAIDFAENALNSLPKTVGLAIKRLSCEHGDFLNDHNITLTCSRFVELRMSQILYSLTSFQFGSDSPILTDYAKLRAIPECVAKVDSTALKDLVSYYIKFIDNHDERIVYAPSMYGGKPLLIFGEFHTKGTGYIPPLSFMTMYCYPQMLLRLANEPDKWNFEWKCESIFVKDLSGTYINEYDILPYNRKEVSKSE